MLQVWGKGYFASQRPQQLTVMGYGDPARDSDSWDEKTMKEIAEPNANISNVTVIGDMLSF